MLRILGFFVLVIVLSSVLGKLPIIGPFFARLGILGIWVTAMALAWGIALYGQRAVRLRRDAARVRELKAVKSPRNLGKLGSIYLAQGRPRLAVEPLREATAGEPETVEWPYRLGCALLRLGRAEEAAEVLRDVCAREEEYAYGKAQMRLAEALSAAGRNEEALEALRVQERNHGPSPESAYRRGLAHKRMGKVQEARSSFAEVGELAAEAARYKRHESGGWAVRAKLASLF